MAKVTIYATPPAKVTVSAVAQKSLNVYANRGEQGPTGPTGPIGATGPTGPTGDTGPAPQAHSTTNIHCYPGMVDTEVTLTVSAANYDFALYDYVRVYDNGDINTQAYFWGFVSATTSTSVTVYVEGQSIFNGTSSDYYSSGPWTIAFQGKQGLQGVQGATGATGATGADGANGRGYYGVTSATNVTLGYGSVTWYTSNTGAYQPDDFVRVTHSTGSAEGYILSVTSDVSITVSVSAFTGSGDPAPGLWVFALQGAKGDTGVGVASGGTTGQILAKNSNTSYDTGWIDNYTETVKHYVKNDGTALTKGQAVYISGANGTNMVVSPASNTSDTLSAETIGLIAQDLAVNATGFVITEGLLSGFDTSAATVGDPVWLGVSGALIFGAANKPVAPAHLVFLGVVTRAHATQGEVFVRVSNGWELDELHNVLISSPQNNQGLVYESASGLWKNAVVPYASTAGTAVYASNAGTAVYASTAGTATYATTSGTAVSISGSITESQVTNLVSDLALKAALTASQTFTGTQTLIPSAAANNALIVRGASSQSADLVRFENNAAGLLANVTSTGVINAPTFAASTQIRAYTTSSTTQPLIVKGAASQSANLQEWQDSSGTVQAAINSAGAILTNQRATIGATTVSALAHLTVINPVATRVGTATQASASQTADLAQYISSPGTVLGGRNALAQIYSGSTAPLTQTTGGATTAASGTGTTATITTTSAHGLAVGDLVTVAGVTPTGYNGTYVLTAVTSTTLSYANATTGAQTVAGTVSAPAQLSVNARSAGTVGQIIRGASSPVADLAQWQNSSGTTLVSIGSAGALTAPDVRLSGNVIAIRTESSGGKVRFAKTTAAVTNPGSGFAELYFRDGTNAGTLKLVVRAGAAGAETTILDNIPQ